MARNTSKANTKESPSAEGKSYWDKLGGEVQSNQSKLSLVLGALIVLVVGILVFNYFVRNKATLGPAQTTEQETQEDVSPDKLPGKYTVKENDTLFAIAEKYYQDGYQYPEIARANNLTNVDLLEVGQVLQIPKLEKILPSPSPSSTEEPSPSPSPDPSLWGPPIKSDSYTVVEGDWLSKIAGRSYGDVMAYPRIAQANNIANPNLIYPGQVLTIPR